MLLLVSYPFAVFYGAPYTEGLFLLASVAAFYACTHARWGAVLGWGLLAGLTRPNGVLLAPALALLVFSGWRGAYHAGAEVVPTARARACGGRGARLRPGAALRLHVLAHRQPAAVDGRASLLGPHRDRVDVDHGPVDYISRYGLLAFFRDAQPQVLNLLAAIFALVGDHSDRAAAGPRLRRARAAERGAAAVAGRRVVDGPNHATLFPIFLWLAATAPGAPPRGVGGGVRGGPGADGGALLHLASAVLTRTAGSPDAPRHAAHRDSLVRVRPLRRVDAPAETARPQRHRLKDVRGAGHASCAARAQVLARTRWTRRPQRPARSDACAILASHAVFPSAAAPWAAVDPPTGADLCDCGVAGGCGDRVRCGPAGRRSASRPAPPLREAERAFRSGHYDVSMS
jgi:hypothetical protein